MFARCDRLGLAAVLLALVAVTPALATAQQSGFEPRFIHPALAAPRRVPIQGGDALVFELHRNQRVEKSEQVFLVAPCDVAFLSTDGHTPDVNAEHYDNRSLVNLSVIVEYPDLDRVTNRLCRDLPGIRASNVVRMNFSNWRLKHDLFELAHDVEPGDEISLSIDNHVVLFQLTPLPTTTRRDVDAFVSGFRAGTVSVKVSAWLEIARTLYNATTITWQQVAETKSFRDFEQLCPPGQIVLASQVAGLSTRISRELAIDGWDEFPVAPDSAYAQASRAVFDEMLTGFREGAVEVSALAAQLQKYAIDLQSRTYQPDVLRSLVLDVKNTRKTEFESKFKSTMLQSFQEKKTHKTTSDASLAFFADFLPFDAAHKFEHDWNRMTDQRLETLLEDNQYFFDEYDRSFKVDFEGDIATRVSVVAYERLSGDLDLATRARVSATKVIWDDGWLSMGIRPGHIRTELVPDGFMPPFGRGR